MNYEVVYEEFRLNCLEVHNRTLEKELMNLILKKIKMYVKEIKLTEKRSKRNNEMSYYLEQSKIMDGYIQLLKSMILNCKNERDNRKQLLQIEALVDFIFYFYELDIEELNKYFLSISIKRFFVSDIIQFVNEKEKGNHLSIKL